MNSNHYSCERPEHGWGTPPMLIKTFGVIIMRQPAKNKHQTSVCFSIESTGVQAGIIPLSAYTVF